LFLLRVSIRYAAALQQTAICKTRTCPTLVVAVAVVAVVVAGVVALLVAIVVAVVVVVTLCQLPHLTVAHTHRDIGKPPVEEVMTTTTYEHPSLCRI